MIKLLAIAKEGKDGLEIRVHPTMIPKTHPIASVRNEFNGITINGNFSGELTFQGRGAGGNPTASAVVSDIINVAHDIASKPSYEFRLIRIENIQKRKIRKIGQIESHYYIRLSVLDRPGVLAKIAKALAQNRISIDAVIQKEYGKKIVPLVLMTHRTKESNIGNALKKITKLKVATGKIQLIRIEK